LLDVPKELFAENNKLLEGLSEEVKRLRSESKGLNMTVESMTEENVLLKERLESFGERVAHLQIKFDEVLETNQALLEERNNLKLEADALTLNLAQAESALNVQRAQYQEKLKIAHDEAALRELLSHQDQERLNKQISALRNYASRLEKECTEQYDGRINEITTSKLAHKRLSLLKNELETTRKLLLIEESKNKTLVQQQQQQQQQLQKQR
jgi:hypothetical protein